MLFATLLFIVYFCICACFQYDSKRLKLEVPIEYHVWTPEQFDEVVYSMLESTETNETETTETETDTSYVDQRIADNETWTVDEVNEVDEETPVDEVEPEQESLLIRCFTLLDSSLEDLIDLAKSNGLKPTKRWRRETLITKLNAILETA